MARYIQHPITHKLIPADEYVEPNTGMGRSKVIGDMPDFVSPIDGTVVHGRKGWREMCKAHDVTHASDFTGQWERNAEQRRRLAEGKDKKDRQDRLKDVIRAYNGATNG